MADYALTREPKRVYYRILLAVIVTAIVAVASVASYAVIMSTDRTTTTTVTAYRSQTYYFGNTVTFRWLSCRTYR